MSSFILKIIALISMICDHTGKVFFSDISFLVFIGRFAFPIFAFQITQGYIHTKNKTNYAIRFLIFAIISQLPYTLFLNTCNYDFKLNIFFTLFLGLISIIVYDKISKIKIDYLTKERKIYKNYKENPLYFLNIFIALSICFLISFLALVIKCDYGMYGVLIILLFYIFKDKKLYKTILFTLLTFLHFLPNLNTSFYIWCFIFTTLSIIPILLYNGKKGKNIKYLFYIIYPTHLLLLVLIKSIL